MADNHAPSSPVEIGVQPLSSPSFRQGVNLIRLDFQPRSFSNWPASYDISLLEMTCGDCFVCPLDAKDWACKLCNNLCQKPTECPNCASCYCHGCAIFHFSTSSSCATCGAAPGWPTASSAEGRSKLPSGWTSSQALERLLNGLTVSQCKCGRSILTRNVNIGCFVPNDKVMIEAQLATPAVSLTEPAAPIFLPQNIDPLGKLEGAPAAPLVDVKPTSPLWPIFDYFHKFRGQQGKTRPERSAIEPILQNFILAFCGILPLSLIHYFFLRKLDLSADVTMLVGSFGASAVLLYGVCKSPLAQPRNVFGGHLLSALWGMGLRKWVLPYVDWLAPTLAVSGSIFIMDMTETTHPPGGATALIAVIGGAAIEALGWWYVLIPIGLGAVILLLVALIGNNIFPGRHYPQYWW